ncbi:MAG: hypothetical protein IKT94_05715 [Rikenellaceae bacterium]|nr:hypothetical protein [Rikenellaceae bacterium]
MKKLLLLLALCCAAVACEREGHFDFSEVGELDPNTANGIYQIATNTSFVVYENGIPVRFGSSSELDDYYPSTLNVFSYIRIQNGKLDLLHEYQCKQCGDSKIFCWEYYSTPIDLQNRLIWENSMEIYKYTNDEIILIESIGKATKNDSQNFWRCFDVYKRIDDNKKFDSITYIKHSDNPQDQEKIDFCENNHCKQQ